MIYHYLMSFTPSILLNLIPNIRDITSILKLKKALSPEVFSNPTLFNYIHVEKYGYLPPKMVHTIYRINADDGPSKKTIPWQLEFSFLPQEALQVINGKTYFIYGCVFSKALQDKDKWVIDFLLGVVPTLPPFSSFLLSPSGKQLSREEIDYIGEVARTVKYLDINAFIDNLADYGNLDYFREAMKKVDITPSSKNLDRFTRRLVENGKENLLEAYRKHRRGDYRELTIKKYHPDQRRIPTIDRVQLNSLEMLETKNYEGAYKVLKKGRDILKPLETSLEFPDFIRWMTREHPEDTKKWYHNNRSNIDILIHRDKKVEHPNSSLLKSIIASGYPWEKIAPIFKDDYWPLKRFTLDLIGAQRYDLISKYYKESGSLNFKKAIEDALKERGPQVMYEEIIG